MQIESITKNMKKLSCINRNMYYKHHKTKLYYFFLYWSKWQQKIQMNYKNYTTSKIREDVGLCYCR